MVFLSRRRGFGDRLGDHEMTAPFLDGALLDAGLKNHSVVTHVDTLENLAGGTELLGIQVDKIAARAARLQRLVAADGLDLVAAPPPKSVHQIHNVTGLELEKMFPAEIIVRDEADVSVTSGKLELRGDARYTGDEFRFACWLRNHAHEMAAVEIEPVDILNRLFG